jgi:hypothetical protein
MRGLNRHYTLKKPQYESDFGFPSVMYRWKGDTRMSYEVRNVKGFEGMEGLGYNAMLYRDGIKVAFVIDEGNGGEMLLRWADCKASRVEVPWSDYQGKPNSILCTPEEAKLYEFIRGKMVDYRFSGQSQISIGIFLAGLVDDYESPKRFKRICKTKTLFRVKGDKSDEWRTIKEIFSKRIKDFIVGKYGDQVESIMNESLGQVAV